MRSRRRTARGGVQMEPSLNVLLHHWTGLLDAVTQQCLGNNQDPAALQSNLGHLKVSLPLYGEVYFPWMFSAADLLTEDPLRLAEQFYRAYRRAREEYFW